MNIQPRRINASNALACSIALALAVIAPSAMASKPVVMAAHATTLRPNDRISRALAASQPMPIAIALKLRNTSQLHALIAARRTVTPAQFATQFAPTQAQAQAVAQYLAHHGYTDVKIAPNRMLVTATGTAGMASAAFATTFARVQTGNGRIAYANTTPAYIPASLQGSVLSVIGLQSVYQAHVFAPRVQATTSTAITSHDPTEFSAIYGATGVPTAAGITVGIISQGNIAQTLTDLATFTASHGLPTVTTQVVNTGGTSTDISGVIEWNLDSQSIVGMAGGQVGKLIFYAEPSLLNTSLVANFNTVVTANAAKIINVSLGECELGAQQDGSAAAANQIFQQAVAQGQTFSVSTGDHGADECGNGGTTPSWPANSPYVVAVAGTLLATTNGTWGREVVWNNLPGFGATGGSPSTYEPKPSWQDALVPGSTRGVADVAFDASPFSGAQVVYKGNVVVVGGTSLSAPIFAGSWARVLAVKGLNVGFAAPLLYQLPASDFHDVVSGNNGGEAAGPGYDFASGRGSLILGSAISHLGGSAGDAPPVANFGVSVLGLSAHFTDHSTDSDGTIVAHAWTFGDGARSTAINPQHLYALAGTYTVTETVTDNAGVSSIKSMAVKIGR